MEAFNGTIIELLWDFLSHVPEYQRLLEVMKRSENGVYGYTPK